MSKPATNWILFIENGMKLVIAVALLLVAGCTRDTAAFDDLRLQNGTFYDGDSKQPFSGIAYDYWPNGEIRMRQSFVNGKEHGWTYTWYENGDKSSEGEWLNGEQVGIWTYWDRDGDKVVYDKGN